MFVLLFNLFIFAVTFYLYLTLHFNYWKRRGIAGPTPFPYVGNFPKTVNKTSNYIEETTDIYR